jgi:hypothetical protein
MKQFLKNVISLMAMVSLTVGIVRVFIFLFHQWNWIGVLIGFTFIPPMFICPIWEWVVTGKYLTFILIYGGFLLLALLFGRDDS